MTAIEIVQQWAIKNNKPEVVEACTKAERITEYETLIREIRAAIRRGWNDNGLLAASEKQLIGLKKFFNA